MFPSSESGVRSATRFSRLLTQRPRHARVPPLPTSPRRSSARPQTRCCTHAAHVCRSGGIAGVQVVLVWFAVFAVAGDPAVGFAQADASPLEDLRARLTEQLTSLSSLSVRFTRQFGDDTPQSWTWMEDGARKCVASEAVEGVRGKRMPPTWYSFDGECGYSVAFDPEDFGQKLDITKTAEIPEFYNHPLTPAFWLGSSLSNTTETLLTLLDRDEAVLVGMEEIDGFRCAHVDLGDNPCDSGSRWHWDVWLDLQHDCLPRRITSVPVDNERLRNLGCVDDLRVVEFQRVEDTAFSTHRWFPTEMISTSLGRMNTLSVQSVELNVPIPREAFIPEPDFGTRIAEVPAVGEARRVTVYGGEAALQARRGRIVERAHQLAREARSAEGPHVDASPRSNAFLFSVLRWAALGALLLAGWLVRRRP